MDDQPEYSDHEKAIEEIAKKHNLEVNVVRNMINGFFFRIQKFIRNQVNFPIPEIGDIHTNDLGKKMKGMKYAKDSEFQSFTQRRRLLLKKHGKKTLWMTKNF